MQIIRNLTQAERQTLLKKHSLVERNRCIFNTHFANVINQQYCYETQITAEDYNKIWIYAGLSSSSLYPYSSLYEAVCYIKSHPSFLDTSAKGFLNGQQLRYYLEQIRLANEALTIYFAGLEECFLLDQNGRNEVTDGMHRLVAYGLATNLQEIYFPISLFLGTSKTPQEIDLI